MATFTVTTTPQVVASASTDPQLFVNNGVAAEIVLTDASSGAVLAVLRPGGASGVQASAVLSPSGSVNAATRRDTASLDVTTSVVDAGMPGAGSLNGGSA